MQKTFYARAYGKLKVENGKLKINVGKTICNNANKVFSTVFMYKSKCLIVGAITGRPHGEPPFPIRVDSL